MLILKFGVFVATSLCYLVFVVWTATRSFPFETQAGMVALVVAGAMTVNLIQVDRGWSMERVGRWLHSPRWGVPLVGLMVMVVGVWVFKPHAMDFWARATAVSLAALAALRILPQDDVYWWLGRPLSWAIIVGLVLYIAVWFSQLFQEIRADLRAQHKQKRKRRR